MAEIFTKKDGDVGGGRRGIYIGNFKIQIGISKISNFTFKCYIFLSKIDWIGIPQKSLFVTKHATYVFYSKEFSQFQLDKPKVFICNIKIFLKMPFFTVYNNESFFILFVVDVEKLYKKRSTPYLLSSCLAQTQSFFSCLADTACLCKMTGERKGDEVK